MKVRLKELGEIITGNTPSKKIKEFWNSEDIYFIKPDIIEDSGVNEISETNEYISEEARKKARIVTKKSIFVTCIGSIGKIGIASAGEYAFNQQINAIVPNEKVQSKYLAYNLLYNKPRLVAMANAPVVPIINKRQFGEFIVNIETDIGRQVKIVNVLDRLTHIIRLSKQELEKLDELIKARFVEMFGDPVTSLKGRKQVPFSEFMTDIKYGTSQPPQFSEDGEYKFIRATNIKKGRITEENMLRISEAEAAKIQKCKLLGNEIIIVRSGANTGDTCVVTTEYAENYAGYDIIITLDLTKANPVYFNELINTHYMEQIVKPLTARSAQPHLNTKQVQGMPMIVASMDEQNEFAVFVEQVDKSKVAVQKALGETQTLFDSLMQEYFG